MSDQNRRVLLVNPQTVRISAGPLEDRSGYKKNYFLSNLALSLTLDSNVNVNKHGWSLV